MRGTGADFGSGLRVVGGARGAGGGGGGGGGGGACWIHWMEAHDIPYHDQRAESELAGGSTSNANVLCVLLRLDLMCVMMAE